MSNQNLLIYKYTPLYHLLDELSLNFNFNFNIFFVDNEKLLKDKIKSIKYYLIISDRKYLDLDNQFAIDDLPNNILKLVEKINIEFLRQHFISQSDLKLKRYTINLNSREMLCNNVKLKLTEKEINIIFYLSKLIKPASVNELQEKVWSYNSDIETHTVETHIYRLRKKIFDIFGDGQFILSKKDGYQIK